MNKDIQNCETILIIDDDVELTSLISQFLRWLSGKCRTQWCKCAHRCYDIQPDLIVLDLMLPGVDGLTICPHLSQTSLTLSLC